MSHFLKLGCMALLVIFLLALAPAAGANPAMDNTVWSGEYYNNISLAGPPALLRADPAIDFFWPEYTSPAPGFVNVDNYSVRWTRSVLFDTAGNWVFTTVNDDGMRVWVDNQSVVDAWYDQGPTTHTGTIYLGVGYHLVRVEYYNHTLGGTARLSYALQGSSSYPDWKGEYYNNQYLSGAPIVVRNDPSINFNWGYGSPDPSIPVDHFSARWTRSIYTTAGTWRFATTTDDGVRLWVDNNLIIDRWYDQGAVYFPVDISLATGVHSVRMEYFEDTGLAVAQFTYGQVTAPPPPPSGSVWHGQYYNNISLSGNPVLVRDDPSLHFDWGFGSPNPVVPVDYFSAKWDSIQYLPTTGNYTVLVSSDDGVRVWIDGVLVVDAWYDHSPTLFSSVRYLAAGAHAVHVEYYERTMTAMIGVDINPGSTVQPPTGDVIVDDQGVGWQAGGDFGDLRAVSNGYGGHAFWTFNNSYTAPHYNWARWYPALPRAGYYEVSAYIPGGIATTTSARYWVYHGGRFDLRSRAQVFYANQWMSLGTLYFSGTGGEYVSLSDVTYECFLCRTVAFDAVKFSPR